MAEASLDVSTDMACNLSGRSKYSVEDPGLLKDVTANVVVVTAGISWTGEMSVYIED